MGCTSSKNDISEMDGPGSTDTSTMTPEDMIKELDKLSRSIKETKEKMRPVLAEKTGLNVLLGEQQTKLAALMQTKDDLLKQRDAAMDKVWEKDAEEIAKAFKAATGLDKGRLTQILCNRTKWQVEAIAVRFEKRTGRSLLQQVVNDMTTTLGSMLTGTNTYLSQLLVYRIMPQPDRDGAKLRDFSDGLSLMDEHLLEILVTRSNAENREAIKCYLKDHKKNFIEIVKSKSQGTFGTYKNYRDFMMKLLECRRDEDNLRFDTDKAKALANELFDARNKMIKDEAPFIRIFSTINRAQFESINDHYPGKVLLSDIPKVLGGALSNAVLAMSADKYDFLAGRLEQALTRWGSADKDTVCRVLGCCSRVDCARIKESYMERFKRSLDDDLRAKISQKNYLDALLTLTAGDVGTTPLGSDKEQGEDETDNAREGGRQRDFFVKSYKDTKTIERGMAELARLRKKGPASSRIDNPAFSGASSASSSAANAANAASFFSTADEDDEELGIHFEVPWDAVKGRLWKDKNRLANCLDEYRTVYREAQLGCERLGDEVAATKEVYFGIVRLCYETEAWHRTLSNHLKCIDRFMKSYPANKKGVLGLGM